MLLNTATGLVMKQGYVTLSPFEWVIGGAAFLILLGAVGFMLTTFVRDIKERMREHEKEMEAETSAREAGDTELARLIKETTSTLHTMALENVSARSKYAERDKVQASHARIHERLDEIRENVLEIKAHMVTKDECRASRCGS